MRKLSVREGCTFLCARATRETLVFCCSLSHTQTHTQRYYKQRERKNESKKNHHLESLDLLS